MRRILDILKLKPAAAQPGEINHPIFDRFTLVHFLIGCAYGRMGLEFWTVLFLAIAWELLENPLKALLPSIFPNGTADSIRNMISDTIAVLTGWFVIIYFVV